ncbi:hypothetical protein BBP40_002149 [Aspergillus hancockii]|nr:hypothetical protein BBP40_002149 [Aspergillus hancockii]
MDFSPQDRKVSKTCDQNIRAQFIPTLQRLQSSLERLESFASVLQGDNSLARHFDIPLASDTKAGKIDSLFDELQLVEDDDGEVDNGIRWLDIILEPTYQPTLREDGYHYLQLNGRKGRIKLSDSDHKFIESNIPYQLVDPLSYPSDVRAEEKAMQIVEELLITLNKVASQIINTNNECQANLNERLAVLRQLSSYYRPPQPINVNSNDADPQPRVQCEATNLSKVATHERTKKSPSNPPWDDEELDRLPQWFQKHKHLRTDKVEFEAQFEKDFGKFRTVGAIVTASYRAEARKRYGTRGKRKRPQDDVSPPSTAIVSAAVAHTSIGPPSRTSASTPGPPVSFLTALRTFSKPDRSSGSAIEMLHEKSDQTRHPGALVQENAIEGPAWDETPIHSAPRAEVRTSGQPGTIILQSAADENGMDGRSSGSDRQPTQFCSSDTGEENKPNASDSEPRNFGSFQPINLPSQESHSQKKPKTKCDRQRPSCNNCIQGNLACEGYNRLKPIRSKASSTWQYPQETALYHVYQNNPLKDAVEPNTAINHYEQSGSQPNISAVNPGSSSRPSNGTWSTSPFVLGQGAPGCGDALTSNKLPPPINPGIGHQVIPPINRIFDGQHVIPSHPAFPGRSQQP